MENYPYHLDRTVVIQAEPETVFRYFTDSARFANWWGAGSTIDATPGGKVHIRHTGVEILGEVLSVDPPRSIVFTYGYATGEHIPPGGSRVHIRLEPHAQGTALHLTHHFAEESARDLHVQGWRFQLSVFANVVANENFAAAVDTVDAWYAAWQIKEDARRAAEIARIAHPRIEFRDRYSLLQGYDDLSAHIAAAQRFMPGIVLSRAGNVRHCQGTVLSEWSAGPVSGTSVFQFAADGRILSVTGIANPQ
ncbi:MAG TPA: SRPBCC domain-containing protein [Candidatus Limnocylindrales bacterium]|nr:SRPBCC domain-containing protein [Candidatus Limnocylindrales bacterium]